MQLVLQGTRTVGSLGSMPAVQGHRVGCACGGCMQRINGLGLVPVIPILAGSLITFLALPQGKKTDGPQEEPLPELDLPVEEPAGEDARPRAPMSEQTQLAVKAVIPSPSTIAQLAEEQSAIPGGTVKLPETRLFPAILVATPPRAVEVVSQAIDEATAQQQPQPQVVAPEYFGPQPLILDVLPTSKALIQRQVESDEFRNTVVHINSSGEVTDYFVSDDLDPEGSRVKFHLEGTKSNRMQNLGTINTASITQFIEKATPYINKGVEVYNQVRAVTSGSGSAASGSPTDYLYALQAVTWTSIEGKRSNVGGFIVDFDPNTGIVKHQDGGWVGQLVDLKTIKWTKASTGERHTWVADRAVQFPSASSGSGSNSSGQAPSYVPPGNNGGGNSGEKDNTLLYAGLGVGGVLLAGGIALAIGKKKKSGLGRVPRKRGKRKGARKRARSRR